MNRPARWRQTKQERASSCTRCHSTTRAASFATAAEETKLEELAKQMPTEMADVEAMLSLLIKEGQAGGAKPE